MYLTYLDDGGKGTLKVFGGIVLEESWFRWLESRSAMIVIGLLNDEQRKSFEEFHASDLFLGQGIFSGVDEARRHQAIRALLSLKNEVKAPYFYSAVDTAVLNRSPFRSASWLDVAFSLCAVTINDAIVGAWAEHAQRCNEAGAAPQLSSFLNLMIVDEPEQHKHKQQLKASFRSFRQSMARGFKHGPSGEKSLSYQSRLMASVDDMFFGSSADSVGLQVADTCNWVMWRHLCGDPALDFYDELTKGVVVCAKPEPEWSQYQHLLKSHD